MLLKWLLHAADPRPKSIVLIEGYLEAVGAKEINLGGIKTDWIGCCLIRIYSDTSVLASKFPDCRELILSKNTTCAYIR